MKENKKKKKDNQWKKKLKSALQKLKVDCHC